MNEQIQMPKTRMWLATPCGPQYWHPYYLRRGSEELLRCVVDALRGHGFWNAAAWERYRRDGALKKGTEPQLSTPQHHNNDWQGLTMRFPSSLKSLRLQSRMRWCLTGCFALAPEYFVFSPASLLLPHSTMYLIIFGSLLALLFGLLLFRSVR